MACTHRALNHEHRLGAIYPVTFDACPPRMSTHSALQTASNMLLQVPSRVAAAMVSLACVTQDKTAGGRALDGCGWHGMALCDFMPFLLGLATYIFFGHTSAYEREGREKLGRLW